MPFEREQSVPLVGQLARLRLDQQNLPRSSSFGMLPPHITDPRLRHSSEGRENEPLPALSARPAQAQPPPAPAPSTAVTQWLGSNRAATLPHLLQQRVTGSPGFQQELFQFPILEQLTYDPAVVRRRPDYAMASHLSGNQQRHAFLFPTNGGPLPPGQTIAGNQWADTALDLFDTEGCILQQEWFSLEHVLAVIRLAIAGDRGAVWIYRDAILNDSSRVPVGAHGPHRGEASLKRYWIFPCNFNARHWAVATLDRATDQVTIFNSSGIGTGAASRRSLKANLTAAIAGTSFWSVQRADLDIRYAKCPRQPGGWECGLWVGEFVRVFLQDMAMPARVQQEPHWLQTRCYRGAERTSDCQRAVVGKWLAAIRRALGHPENRPLRDPTVIMRAWDQATTFDIPAAAAPTGSTLAQGRGVVFTGNGKTWVAPAGAGALKKLQAMQQGPLTRAPGKPPTPPKPVVTAETPRRRRPPIPAPGTQVGGVPAPQPGAGPTVATAPQQPHQPPAPPPGPTRLPPVYDRLGPAESNYVPEHPPWFRGWDHVREVRAAAAAQRKGRGGPRR